jgi:hypothetical protein
MFVTPGFSQGNRTLGKSKYVGARPRHRQRLDEELLYFIVRVEVVKIQIWFELKLVCNLQKGLTIYKGFSIFLRCIGPNSRSPPSRSTLTCGPRPAQHTGAHASHVARSDPFSVNPTG